MHRIIAAVFACLLVFTLAVPVAASSAAYYSPSYDYGGWDRIRTIQARNNGLDPSQVYDPDGFYCAMPVNYDIGTTLYVTNTNTGVTASCVIADHVAPRDEAYWYAHFGVEMAYAMWTYLDLASGNDVSISLG